MKKIMLMMFILVLLVGTVSALTLTTWDNIKYYDKEENSILIRNNFILKDLEKATLLSNTYNCISNCKAEKEITIYDDGVLIEDLRFYRMFMNGSKELSEPRRHSLKYYADVGESVCDGKLIFKQLNGTKIRECHIEFNGNNREWVNYNLGTEVKAGTYQVELTGRKKIYQTYDWQIKLQGRWINEWATWGNISLGDQAEVLLITPLNETSFKLNDPVFYNSSANVTGGDKLENMSLYDDSSGTWKLNETINLSGGTVPQAGVSDAHGIAFTFTSATNNVWQGMRIVANDNIRVNNFTRGVGVTASTAYILGSDKALLAQVNFTGNSAMFSFDLVKGNTYFLVADSEGRSWDSREGPATAFFVPQTNVNWTGALINNATNNNNIWTVFAVNTSVLLDTSVTFSAQNFSKNVLKDTVWNVQGCDNTGACGFAVSNRTILVKPTINVFSPTNTTHTISILFFNATNDTEIDTWIVNYNGTNVTIDINTTLTVEDGSTFQLLLYANNTNGNFGLNDSIFFSVDTIPTINVFSPTNITFTTSTIFFNATNTTIVDTWIVNYNGTNITNFNINSTLEVEDGFHQLKLYANGTGGTFGLNDTIFFTVDGTTPQINLTSPTGDQGTFTSGINLTLRWNVTDTNLDVCFYDYEGSNTTIACLLNLTNLTVTDSLNTSLRFWVNDTVGHHNSSTINWSYSFIENNITFETNVSETSSQFFQINLTTSLSVLSITAQLNYNGTNHISSTSCNGFCIVNNTIDIPLVLVDESETKSFFWEINLFNGTDSISVNISTQSQNVTKVHLETCDATFTTESLNFTAYDEQNLSRLSPYRFEGTFDIWIGSGSVKRNNSFSKSSTTNQSLCIRPNATYFTDAQIEYNTPGNATFYTTRNYYLQNNTINNVSQSIFLYLLSSDSSTSFILKVQDDNLLPLEDHLIKTERFYPGENLFRVIQIAKTSENGKTIGFFETETVDYRFIISLNALNLLTTSQQKIVGEVAPFTLTFTIGENLGKPWKTLENITDLGFSLIFNKSTNIITYTYTDTSGNFTLGTLIVERQNFSFSTNIAICNFNSSQSSATITCNVSGNETGTYIVRGFVTRGTDESLISQIGFIIESFLKTVGMLGVILAWFLILISTFAFKFNEIAGIFMINATVIFVNIIGLVSFGTLAISALIAVSIIIVVVMEK